MFRLRPWSKNAISSSNAKLLLASGCLATGIGIHQYHRPFLADSPPNTSNDWRGKSTVPSHNVSLEDRRAASGVQKSGASGLQFANNPSPPPQTKGHQVLSSDVNVEADQASAWQNATQRMASISDSLGGFDFFKLKNAITDYVVPAWIRTLPGLIKKLQDELSMAPWSLGWEIWEEAHDPEVNPEIVWDAKVRISKQLCQEEQDFLGKRRLRTAKALADYLDIPEADIHPDDVPVIAMCGSGGGLRALVAGTSSFLSAREDGLFDCATYTAGVSGSCWLQTLYYSSIGQTSHARMIEHLKARLGVHIAYPPAALKLLAEAPTNKYLLSGVVEKVRGVPDADFGLVDVYGVLLAARLLVPRGELRISDWDLKVSNQRFFVDMGDQPLPIYTAVRHEIPDVEIKHPESTKPIKKKDTQNDWFQWFEWTPYEFFCEELDAGIPTWAVGREFMGGSNVLRENGLSLPEIKVPLMMGIWGSAFCATLSHYYHEIQPLLKACGLGGLDDLISDKDDDLVKVHPLDPASIPNFALGLEGKLPSSCPESIHHASHLRLMDAGMSNNLPIYPLLRPGRDVDVIIAFDVSADAPIANWIKVVEGYAKQRGIKGWPMGAGWPPRTNTKEQTIKELDEAQSSSAAEAEKRVQSTPIGQDGDDLGHCTVWVGTTVERTNDAAQQATKRLRSAEDDFHLSSPDAGIAVVYYPFLPNEKVPGVDPLESDFMSTWNFVYTPEEVDKVVALAKANYNEGRDQTRRTIRAVYERKRDARLKTEEEEREVRRRLRLRRGEALGRTGEGDHFT